MDSRKIKMVLPTAEELDGYIITATDFALGSGVRFREFVYCEETDTLKYRTHWNSDEFNVNCAYMTTSTIVCRKNQAGKVDFRIKAKFPGNDSQLNYADHGNLNCFVGDHALGIPLKFVNPESAGMTIESDFNYQNTEIGIIKIGNKIPTAPQSYAGSKMSKKLESLMKQKQLKQVGTFTVDGYATRSSYSACERDAVSNEPIMPLACPRFTYQGVDYVRREFVKAKLVRRKNTDGDYQFENGQFSNGTIAKVGKPCWFKCEPYRAMKNRDGSIICLNAVFPCQTEVETELEKNVSESLSANSRMREQIEGGAVIELNLKSDKLAGVRFLNEIFLKEMFQSIGMDLNQVQQQNAGYEKH